MRKLMILAAMLAMALLVAAPAMAVTQSNEGDVIANNESTQNADQSQFAPGGDATFDPGDETTIDTDDGLIIVFDDGSNNSKAHFIDNGFLFDGVVVIDVGDDEEDNDVEVTGGDGGTQELNQHSDQNANATGATLSSS